MRIVIDMQGAQTESRFRGIGRYTLSLAQAIVRNRGEHEILLALNGLFSETIEPIRAAFHGLLPQENIRVWYAPGPVQECEPSNTWRRENAELIREAFLANLQPDIVHISSLFEGYIDDAVTSIGRFDPSTLVSVSLYDLIPLLNPDCYLKPNSNYQQYYLRKISHLQYAGVMLAISEFSRQEGLAHLGVTESQITNISIAIEPRFQSISVTKETAEQLRRKFGLIRPFILYTGGADERKNLPRLIQAFITLPPKIRTSYQLLLVGKMQEGCIAKLNHLARSANLKPDELRFTGYVTDEELVQLYNLCELFVFPSWHEGFGLPALEAMACGAPVIGANTSSLPEVIGLDAALFNPLDVTAIASKMAQALEDDVFRATLRKYSSQQAKHFSWDETAKRAFTAWESLKNSQPQYNPTSLPSGRKPKLAFVSPLPPERTGIADYSAELLPVLAEHYDIEVIVAQEAISNPWIKDHCPVRSIEWFKRHKHRFDRVLYHFGNSQYHLHMFSLLEEIPGTVVLHDFFLSSIVAHRDGSGLAPGSWTSELYHAHGYSAVQQRFHTEDLAGVIWTYPCNFSVLQSAQGVIVHSETSRRLAYQWYGRQVSDNWTVIPLLRTPAIESDRISARQQLKFSKDDFIVCSFGLLDSRKLYHRLLHVWLKSKLAMNTQCILVFIGEKDDNKYKQQLLKIIRESSSPEQIKITGWVDADTFHRYLAAADVAVQLRTHSRGETSAAVLDCMNYALPLIVNANGSAAELDSEAVWMLPDEFTDTELIEALEKLWQEPEYRCALGERARKTIQNHHAPAKCAHRYAEAIERFHRRAETTTPALIQAIGTQQQSTPSDTELLYLANTIATTLPLLRPVKRLFLDVSAIYLYDLKTGIQRVVRSILLEWLFNPPVGYRVEPVFTGIDQPGYYYARRFTLQFLGCPESMLADEPIDFRAGDLFIGLDLQPHVVPAQHQYLEMLRHNGVSIYFIVYDMLPVLLPHAFPPGADASHTNWLHTIACFDGAICISRAVANELNNWFNKNAPDRLRPFDISWFHLGADARNSVPTYGMPTNAEMVLVNLTSRPSFLMVGTIEPRKGYAQTLAAFEKLWAEGMDINLVIVGKRGWMVEAFVKKLRHHPELNKCLFWLEEISDEYLEKIYAASKCLIMASEGEGFGLPLIESAQYKLPIIARDIPVFQEVAGEYAWYFSGLEPENLAEAINQWLLLYQEGKHPKSDAMPWLTWKQSAENLKKVIFERKANLNALPHELKSTQ